MRKSKVTFAVIAYNQQEFISEAIQSAFDQQFADLEIVLSDDCSTDDTFSSIQTLAKNYKGSHKIIVNRNRQNLGLTQHINRIMEISGGELIIACSGDDVSYPERTKVVVAEWQQQPEAIMLLHSSAIIVNKFGHKMRAYSPNELVVQNPSPITLVSNKAFILGATLAWNREIFRKFGPLKSGLSVEDQIIPVLAGIAGEIRYIDRPLVQWRDGGASTARSDKGVSFEYLYGSKHKTRKWQLENDLYILRNLKNVEYDNKGEIEEICTNRARRLSLTVQLAETRLRSRWKLLPTAIRTSLRCGDLSPLKDWSRYSFEAIYTLYYHARYSKKNRDTNQ